MKTFLLQALYAFAVVLLVIMWGLVIWPARAAELPEPLSPGWHKGPVPPNTWYYGGVVKKGQPARAGFHFASFKGDKVMLFDVSMNDRDPANTVLANDQIAYWNNSLITPIVKMRPPPRPEDMIVDRPIQSPFARRVQWLDYSTDDAWARKYDLKQK